MSTVTALCHACNQTYFTSPRVGAGALRCCHCGSDFVEFLSEPAEPRSPRFESTAGRSLLVERRRRNTSVREHHVVSLPERGLSVHMAPYGADDLMRELTHVLGGEPTPGRGSRLGSFRRNFGSEMERLVGQLAQYHQPTRAPATVEAVRGLRREKYNQGRRSHVGDWCVVCHDQYNEGDSLVHLPCGHVFHEDCVLPWFAEHNTCPVCRFALPVQSPATSASPTRHRSGRNQVAQELPHHRDVTGDHVIDSFLDMFRPITGGDVSDRRPRQRRTLPSDDRRLSGGEGERRLRESIRTAQNQLSSLEDRLTEHVAEHRRLQNQIAQLQEHRHTLREQVSIVQHRGLDAVNRMESVVQEHEQRRPAPTSPSVFSRFLGMMRIGETAIPRGSQDNSTTFF